MDLKENTIIKGTVLKVKPFGAIVSLEDNIYGLVHISHISNSYVKDINDHIKIGDLVDVKILSIDTENNKISLSIKEALKNEEVKISREKSTDNVIKYKKTADADTTFEEKFKDWLKSSNERQAGLNKRNKRR